MEGLCKPLLMPLRLTDTVASFSNIINNVLNSFFDTFVTAYLDGIRIYLYDLLQYRHDLKSVS